MKLNIQQPTIYASVPAPYPAEAGDGSGQWKSPLPYIFSGLALMLAVIGLALILLACSYMKSCESSVEKTGKPLHALQPEMEPRVVVIMAGETNPTHLAQPIGAALRTEQV